MSAHPQPSPRARWRDAIEVCALTAACSGIAGLALIGLRVVLEAVGGS